MISVDFNIVYLFFTCDYWLWNKKKQIEFYSISSILNCPFLTKLQLLPQLKILDFFSFKKDSELLTKKILKHLFTKWKFNPQSLFLSSPNVLAR